MNPNYSINIRGKLIDLSEPKVMGIINITPDSFYSGSRKQAQLEILKTAEKMLEEGASFLDVGGYSSRPGAYDIPIKDELERVIGPVEELSGEFPSSIISIDTFRAEVAKAAIESGAAIVNDISGGHLDSNMLKVVADLGVPYIAMHMRGTPQTMKEMTEYDDVVFEVTKYFSKVIKDCNQMGIKDVIIDPGFGFAKTAEQSFRLLNRLDHLKSLERPILVGVSRKSMIYRTLDITAEEALNGTTVLNTLALFKGAGILRVHDIREATETVKLISQLN